MVEPLGPRLEVPFVRHDPNGQFAHVNRWFQETEPPRNLILVAHGMSLTLFDVQWSGHTHGSGLALGTLRPSETVLAEREGELADPLEFDVLRSRMDGLNRWAAMEAVTSDYDTDESGLIQSFTAIARSTFGESWRQGEADLRLVAHWGTLPTEDAYDRRIAITNNVVLESRFPTARPFVDHLAEQRKVANLLVLMFGAPISFREHRIRHNRFPTRVLSGRIIDHPFVEIVSVRTVRERAMRVPATSERQDPLATVTQIGPDGMTEWSNNYDKWRRFILPSVAVLGRPDAFLEDIVTSTSMAIEAAGSLVGFREGEQPTYGRTGRPTAATYAYRCLDVIDVEFGVHAGGRTELARAIANNYNAVKHFDRGDLPDHRETHLIAELNCWIVRLFALTLTGKGKELIAPHRLARERWRLVQWFEAYRLRIDSGGRWVPSQQASGTVGDHAAEPGEATLGTG
ncbi:hypothetical protein [Cellulosimicrobium sp. CUA-896]|uniref:ApeA N-terminal domain 1-containing protein n=1 Tax=Cellulosimicrobium sp. CUA-896 TaxID=1517881 RepID=UPI0011150CA4|nr:hypothetical protein [Cellulosimicrobium sp. CUA-896]